MKMFSRIRKENDDWVFDYWSDSDPSGELHEAGAILAETETGDVRPGIGLQNVEYTGKAYSTVRSEAALQAVQQRLALRGWKGPD